MRYLTKEWYNLCQQTALNFGMEVHNGCNIYDEELYLQLHKIKEKEFIELQHEVYDVDPRFMLEQDGCALVPADKFMSGEEIKEDDKVFYNMPSEEKDRIHKLIAEYDSRPPFDEEKGIKDFHLFQEAAQKDLTDKLPYEILQQIADIRVFTLGFCTEIILKQLESISEENKKEVNRVLNEYTEAQQAEKIPQSIRGKFSFHDCKVTELTANKNIIIHFDTQGGFTNHNMITFVDSEIIKQDEQIVGSTWLYEELYRTEYGYEAHMLFWGENMPEFIIRCKDIII